MKKCKLIYCIVFFMICILPFAGAFVTEETSSSENRELAEFPSLKTEEGFNIYWLSEAGDYFQEHFGFRQKMVTANAILNGKLLGVSTAGGVIQGENNWLYYKDSLTDYLGGELLSERSLFNIAHTLAMTEHALDAAGVDFVFSVAPNKNTLYGENMPYYDSYKISEESNLKNLKAYLESEGVSYVDLYETLKNQEAILYHERDSHWNNQGASIAGDAILTALNKEHESYEDEAFEIRKDFEGDLDKMLYPQAITPEDEIYYEREQGFSYVGEVGSNFDPRITTENPGAMGNLVMYRDSFGNALLPFMAEAYGNAYFSRGVPYQITNDVAANQPEAVVVVRAERFLPDVAAAPPVLKANEAEVPGTVEGTIEDGAKAIEVKSQGLLTQFTGYIEEQYLETDSLIYLRFGEDLYYEAFPQDLELEGDVKEGGFCLYLAADELFVGMEKFEILVGKNGTYQVVGSGQIPADMLKYPVEETEVVEEGTPVEIPSTDAVEEGTPVEIPSTDAIEEGTPIEMPVDVLAGMDEVVG